MQNDIHFLFSCTLFLLNYALSITVSILHLKLKKEPYENLFSYDSMKYSVNLILTQEQLPLLRHLYEDRF